MHYLNILAFTAAASAIDIRGHDESHCRGNYVTWINAQPDTCYGNRGGISWAWSFAAIPTNWDIQTRVYEGGLCSRESWTARSLGRGEICMGAEVNNRAYSGAGYSFNGKKSSEGVSPDAKDCVMPDLLTLEDGQTYALKGIDEAEVNTMVRCCWCF